MFLPPLCFLLASHNLFGLRTSKVSASLCRLLFGTNMGDYSYLSLFTRALAGGGGNGQAYTDDHYADGEHEEHFGVHIQYTDLYASVAFLAAIYASGVLAVKVLKMPALVGEIFCGILMGPNLLQYVPNEEAVSDPEKLWYILYLLKLSFH